jgi:hypothetical protein
MQKPTSFIGLALLLISLTLCTATICEPGEIDRFSECVKCDSLKNTIGYHKLSLKNLNPC